MTAAALPPIVLVMLGGAAGAALRYLVSLATLAVFGAGLPFGTWAVNIAGSLAMGVLTGALLRAGAAAEPLRLLLGVGVLGGFTTFSAFSLDLVSMLVRGDVVLGVAYAISSVAGGVVALYAGIAATRP
jgi:CrcB protein